MKMAQMGKIVEKFRISSGLVLPETYFGIDITFRDGFNLRSSRGDCLLMRDLEETDAAAKQLMVDFGPLFAYINNRRITLLFAKSFIAFGRDTVKLAAAISGRASSLVTAKSPNPIFSDFISHCAMYSMVTYENVADYLSFRLEETYKHAEEYLFALIEKDGLDLKTLRKVADKDYSGHIWDLLHTLGYGDHLLPDALRQGIAILPVRKEIEYIGGKDHKTPQCRPVTKLERLTPIPPSPEYREMIGDLLFNSDHGCHWLNERDYNLRVVRPAKPTQMKPQELVRTTPAEPDKPAEEPANTVGDISPTSA